LKHGTMTETFGILLRNGLLAGWKTGARKKPQIPTWCSNVH